MTTPERDDPQRLNEPELLEAESYLNRAWRRLGEGLGPFVAEKTGKDQFRGTRDVYYILSEMERSWDTHFRGVVGRNERDRGPRSWVIDLLNFRNEPWAHQVGYDDHDVLKYLYQICQLLRAVSADEQAQAVEQKYAKLGKLIFSQSEPELPRERDSELSDRRAAAYQMAQPRDSVDPPASSTSVDVVLLINAAENLIRSGSYQQAIETCSDAIEIEPTCAEAYFWRWRARNLQGEHGDPTPDLIEALRDPGLASKFSQRAQHAMSQGQLDAAIGDYNIVIDDLHGRLPMAYIKRGNANRNNGMYAQAFDDYRAALECTPVDENGFHFRCDWQVGDRLVTYEESILDRDSLVYFERGVANLLMEDYGTAAADFEKVVDMGPDVLVAQAEYGKELASLLLSQLTEYDRHIEENPDDPQVWHLRGVHYLYDREDYDRAVADFSEAIRLDPDNAEAWKDRGWAHYQRSENDLARDDYSRAIELKPDLSQAWYYRAWVWRRRGEHENAIIDLSQAIALKPDYAAAYHHRGQSYFFIGERDKSQTDFEMAQSLGFRP